MRQEEGVYICLSEERTVIDTGWGGRDVGQHRYKCIIEVTGELMLGYGWHRAGRLRVQEYGEASGSFHRNWEVAGAGGLWTDSCIDVESAAGERVGIAFSFLNFCNKRRKDGVVWGGGETGLDGREVMLLR